MTIVVGYVATAEGSAGCGQNEATHLVAPAPSQALGEGGVLRIHGDNLS